MQTTIPEVVGQGKDGFLRELAAKLTDLATTVASFAQSFTTKELIANITADTGTFRQLTATSTISDSGCFAQLCVGTVCVTKSQFMAVFGASALSQPAFASASAPASASASAAANDNQETTATSTPDAEPAADEPANAIDPTASSTPPATVEMDTSNQADDNPSPVEASPLPATEPTSAAQ